MGIVTTARPRCKTVVGEFEPWWLDLTIIGFEDDEDDDSDDEDDEDLDDDDEDDDDSEDDDSEDDDEDEDDDGDDEDDEKKSKRPPKKNIAGLKSALRKERAARKTAERDLRRERARAKRRKSGSGDSSNKNNGDGKGKDKDQQEEQEDKGPSDREVQLAKKLVDKAVDNEVIRQASKMGFIDPEDAVRLVKRSDIDYFQDDDDPTDVEVDEETVEDALKALKRRKKHLVASGKGGSRTGSSFSGSRKKGKGGLSDDKIRAKFGLPRPM